jgi:hypothetical protein
MTKRNVTTYPEEDSASQKAQALAKHLYDRLTNSQAFVRFWGSSRRPNSSPDYDGPRVVARYRKDVAEHVKTYHEAVELTKKDSV